jgi:hypothetical protein
MRVVVDSVMLYFAERLEEDRQRFIERGYGQLIRDRFIRDIT